jgi:hypothetical protein
MWWLSRKVLLDFLKRASDSYLDNLPLPLSMSQSETSTVAQI